MAQSTQVVQTKMLDYFFSLRKLHTVAFQPIVELADRRAVRVRVPVPAGHADAAAVDRRRSSRRRSTRTAASSSTSTSSRPSSSGSAALEADRRASAGTPPRRYAINLTPVQPARSARSRPRRWPPMVRGGRPRPPPDHDRVHRAAVGPRHRAAPAPGQGAAPARLRVRGRRRRRRLRELRADRRAAADRSSRSTATSSTASATTTPSRRWSRRSSRSAGGSARTLLAEGIERRADLAALTALGVELGQGYLLGRPAADPPRRADRAAAPPRPSARGPPARAARQRPDADRLAARRARVPSRA